MNTASKKKILGLNAAKLYGIEVPAEYQLTERRHARRPRGVAGEPEEHAASGG